MVPLRHGVLVCYGIRDLVWTSLPVCRPPLPGEEGELVLRGDPEL